MKLIDRSPGLFMVFVFFVLYSVVALECWMLVDGSTAAIVLVMLVIATIAGLLVRWMHDLMGDDSPDAPRVSATAAEAEAPAERTHRFRRHGVRHHVGHAA